MDINLTIVDQYRKKYTGIWNAAIQQEMAIIAPYATTMQECAGTSIELPYLGKTELNRRTQRLQQVAFTELATGKRQIKPVQFEKFIGMSTDDPMFMDKLQLTASQVIAEERKAAARKMDEVLLGVIYDKPKKKWRVITQADGNVGGILGPNYTGNDGATLISPLASQTVPADFVYKGTKTAAGMIIDKIVRAKQIMEETEAWHEGSGDTLCMALTPRQKAEILMWEQSQNKDYGFNSLKDGKVNDMLGITFMFTNMLPYDASGNRICPMWLKSKAVMGVWENPAFRVDKRTDYIDLVQVGVTCAYGSTRRDEESFVQVLCSETDAPAA